jgi:phage gp36-like protein
MPYIEQSNILGELSQSELAMLTGDPSGETIDTNKVEAAIASADALINAYLFGRYELPISDGCATIIFIAISLTIYNLYAMKYRDSFVPNEVLSRKSEAVKLLESIAKGKIILAGAASPSKIISNNAFRKNYFTEEQLEEFRDFRE